MRQDCGIAMHNAARRDSLRSSSRLGWLPCHSQLGATLLLLLQSPMAGIDCTKTLIELLKEPRSPSRLLRRRFVPDHTASSASDAHYKRHRCKLAHCSPATGTVASVRCLRSTLTSSKQTHLLLSDVRWPVNTPTDHVIVHMSCN